MSLPQILMDEARSTAALRLVQNAEDVAVQATRITHEGVGASKVVRQIDADMAAGFKRRQ